MTNESTYDFVAALGSVDVAVRIARKDLKTLCHELAGRHETAKDFAKFELCTALVRRLEIAEQEIAELMELIR